VGGTCAHVREYVLILDDPTRLALSTRALLLTTWQNCARGTHVDKLVQVLMQPAPTLRARVVHTCELQAKVR
jgi:hypothetical protein